MKVKNILEIDLEKIDLEILNYYNIFEGSILTKNGDTYEINNLNEKVSFSKLMYKISKNKYLITSPNIAVSFSDDQIVNMNKYIEIEYVSDRVIRIYNDTANYQTITSKLFVFIDDVKIDLEYMNNEGLKEYRRKQKVVKNTLLEDIKNYGKEEE